MTIIQKELENEIASRIDCNREDMIFRGKYVVGKDIKAGQYVFTCTEAATIFGVVDGEIEILKIVDKEAFEANSSGLDEIFNAEFLDVGNNVTVTLENDMILYVENCSGTFRVCEQSWAVPRE